MESYEQRFRAIVGHNYTPSQELDEAQSLALTALIFEMPETEIITGGEFIDYMGWSHEQNIRLSVTVSRDHRFGAEALCIPLDRI